MIKKGGTVDLTPPLAGRGSCFLRKGKGTRMYYPSLEEVKRLAQSSNLVPIYREIMADLETPVSAYLKVLDDALEASVNILLELS